jgi:Nif-specific regulatory protein
MDGFDTAAGSSQPGRARGARVEMQLYGVYEISKLLASPERLEQTLARVVHLLASFLDMRHGLIAVLDEKGMPDLVVGSGWTEATARSYFDALPERAVGRIVATDTPLVVRRIKDDPLWEGWNFGKEQDGDVSFVGVPLREAGRVIGTLTIDREIRDDAHTVLDEDVRFLTMVANLVGQSIRLHRLAARDRERLLEERRRLERELEQVAPERRDDELRSIVGVSSALRAVIDKVRIVARSNSTVLLRGESGTGKELFARAIHDLSPRKARPFIKLNCAALPESVLESELFGHERGAFTGAAAQRKGRFELAHGGTLFLDEIGEISSAFQAKLLRVLQEGEFERVGGTSTLEVDVRLVAATNRNLEEAVALGEFRADLYYRIGVIPIFLPALRDRAADIPVLAAEFLRRFNQEHGSGLELSAEAIDVLSTCMFPGNVRELENCVRRTATLAGGPVICAPDFACHKHECLSAALWEAHHPHAGPNGLIPASSIRRSRSGAAGAGYPSAVSAPREPEAVDDAALDHPPHEGDDREQLIQAMEAAGWVQAKAARLLGITARQLGYALRKHEIAIKRF